MLSGVSELPGAFILSGIATLQSGNSFSALDPDEDVHNHPTADLSRRAVIDGSVVEKGTFRNEPFYKVDLRISKFFDFGQARLEVLAEIFNLFNTKNFAVTDGSPTRTSSQMEYYQGDGVTPNPEFGLGGRALSIQRQLQIGIKFTY